MTRYKPKSIAQLRKIIHELSEKFMLDLSLIDVSELTDLSYALCDKNLCHPITDFSGLSTWNTSKVTSFEGLFKGLLNFKGEGIENWDVSLGRNFKDMFSNCLCFNANLNKWKLCAAENLNHMFLNCSLFTGKGIEEWNLPSGCCLDGLFEGCTHFNADMSRFNVNDHSDLTAIFKNCVYFEGKGLENWDARKIRKFYEMFSGCRRLAGEKLKSWHFGNNTKLDGLFKNFSNLGPWLRTLDVSSVVSMKELFENSNVDSSWISNWDVSNVTDMAGLFKGCRNFDDKNLEKWNTASLENLNETFANTNHITGLGLKHFKVENVISMDSTFEDCHNYDGYGLERWNTKALKSLKKTFKQYPDYRTEFNADCLTDWNISKVTSLKGTFSGVNFSESGLEGLRKWDTRNVRDMSYIFSGADIRKDTSPLKNWSTVKVTTLRSAFNSTSGTVGPGLEHFCNENVRSLRCTFCNCEIENTKFLSTWNTSAVEDMTGLFFAEKNIWSYAKDKKLFSCLPLKEWDTSKVIYMGGAFAYRDISGEGLEDWVTDSVKDMYGMFNGCVELDDLHLKKWKVKNVADMSFIFFNCKNMSGEGICHWKTTPEKCSYAFSFADKLTEDKFNGFDFSYAQENQRDVKNMFTGCSQLKNQHLVKIRDCDYESDSLDLKTRQDDIDDHMDITHDSIYRF